MANVWWITRRELGSFLCSPLGYIVIAAVLALDGLLFNVFAVGSANTSTKVIEQFFFLTSGPVMFAAAFISMKLIAEERQTGTMTLLATSPVREHQLVLGKFLAGFLVIALLTLLTVYMPVLVMINGKVSAGHLVAGYTGILLLGAASLSLAMVCSALAPNQLVALVLAAVLLVFFVLLWFVSRIASPPVEDLLAFLSIHDKHFRPFMRGLISTMDVVFYLTLTWVGLLITTRVLEARRWR